MGSGQSKRRRGNGDRSADGNRISMKLSEQLRREEKKFQPVGDSDEMDRCYSFSSSDSSDMSSLCHLSDEEVLEPEKSPPKEEELPKRKEKKNGTPPPPLPPLPKEELPKRKEKNGTPPPAPQPMKDGPMLESDRGGGSSKGETPKGNGKTVRFTAEEKGKGKVVTSPERRGNVRSDVGRKEEDYAFEEPRPWRNQYPCGPTHHCGCQENNWDNHDSEDNMAEILAQATYFFNDHNTHSNCQIM